MHCNTLDLALAIALHSRLHAADEYPKWQCACHVDNVHAAVAFMGFMSSDVTSQQGWIATSVLGSTSAS